MRILVNLDLYPIQPFFHTIMHLSKRRGIFPGIGYMSYIEMVKRK